jgi:hypothetical protein
MAERHELGRQLAVDAVVVHRLLRVMTTRGGISKCGLMVVVVTTEHPQNMQRFCKSLDIVLKSFNLEHKKMLCECVTCIDLHL